MKVFNLTSVFASLVAIGLILVAPAQAADDGTEALNALVQLLGESDDPAFHLDILKGMAEGLKGRRSVSMPAGWEAAARKLKESPNAEVRALAESLGVTFGSTAALASLRETLLNSSAGFAARSNALASLVQTKDPQLPSALQRLLDDQTMRRSALRALAAYDDPKTPTAILSRYSSLTAAEKVDALNTLASRASYAKALLAAVARKEVATRDLTADIVRQLRNLKDPEIDQQVALNWGVARESAADKLAEIARFKKLIQEKGYGDARRGRAVFNQVCLQCHTLFGEGGKVAPDITGSNRSDLDYILQNAVDPNAVIPNDYRTSNIETKDDRSITGVVTRQDDNAITVVTANETLVIPRSEISSLLQTELSMMPEGLLQALTENDVRDLLAYLRSPAQVPLPENQP